MMHHDAPRSSRRAILLPVECDRWMLSTMGRGKQEPPADWDSLLRFLRQLTTPTIYNAVRKLTPMGELTRFAFSESIWRHFEEVDAFPDGLIPIGDAICRFNPLYGQGMTVASKEAELLHRMLAARASEDDPLEGLGRAFLAEATPLIETRWMMAAIPDFVFQETRGERPADLEERLRFAGALSRVAAPDAAVQRLMIEVWHMLRSRSAYQDPELVRLIEEEMAMAWWGMLGEGEPARFWAAIPPRDPSHRGGICARRGFALLNYYCYFESVSKTHEMSCRRPIRADKRSVCSRSASE